MHVVAVVGEAEDRAVAEPAAAEALGRTLYELRQQLAPPLPRALLCCAAAEEASAATTRLQGAGWAAVAIDADAIPAALELSSLKLADDAAQFGDRHGRSFALAYAACRLLLVGVRSHSSVKTVSEERRKISPSRFLITGGLSMSKKVRSEYSVQRDSSIAFARLLTDGLPPLELREDLLRFETLGDRLQPTRSANFRLVLELLQARAPQMLVDERLRQQVGWSRLLPPGLNAEQHGEVALRVLAAGLAPLSG